jgi:hypothetical protein
LQFFAHIASSLAASIAGTTIDDGFHYYVVTLLHLGDLAADFHYLSGEFVAPYPGIYRKGIFPVGNVHIGTANTHPHNFDENILGLGDSGHLPFSNFENSRFFY